MSVALLGRDGAGKSTLASGIEGSFPLPVRRVSMGLWQQSRHSFSVRLPGLNLAMGLLTAWGRFLPAQYHRSRGRLVIFDRYTYDALLAPRQHMPMGGRLYFWLLGHACPAPDLMFVLDAPGDLMYQRKHEHNPAQLELQRQRFLALRQALPRLEVVNAARPGRVLGAGVGTAGTLIVHNVLKQWGLRRYTGISLLQRGNLLAYAAVYSLLLALLGLQALVQLSVWVMLPLAGVGG